MIAGRNLAGAGRSRYGAVAAGAARIACMAVWLAAVTACGATGATGAAGAAGAAGDGPADAVGERPAVVRVLAAASLTDVFTAIAEDFERRHPGVRVEVAFAGSQTLVTQLAAGAPADVLATADLQAMGAAVAQDLAGRSRNFASNRLVVVVPGPPDAEAPPSVTAVADLARPGIRLVLAAPEVPAGRHSRRALDRLGLPAALDNVVSEEADVRGVLAKVLAGEADAGIVYATDIPTAATDALTVLDLPQDPEVVYPIAVTTGTRSPQQAAAFADFVLGDGQRRLRDAGFLPPAGALP